MALADQTLAQLADMTGRIEQAESRADAAHQRADRVEARADAAEEAAGKAQRALESVRQAESRTAGEGAQQPAGAEDRAAS